MLVMGNEPIVWTDLFFSGDPPESIKATETNSDKDFSRFIPEGQDLKLRGRIDQAQYTGFEVIQVFWLWSNGHRKYVGKIFPDYTRTHALQRIHYRPTALAGRRIRDVIDDAVHEFDRFCQEARAYTHIYRFCPAHERIYFPKFHGVVTDMQRYSSEGVNQRAIVLEALRPSFRSRRVLGENTTQLPEPFSDILTNSPLSPFEYEWYCSLLKDRIRRLDALHRINVTHGDIEDRHFRIPGDFYDTVLYDFSESYTFSVKMPLILNDYKPRPLKGISDAEQQRVKSQVEQRAINRDFRSHLIELSSQDTVDDALSQSLDREEELLELIVLKVYHSPDYFSMPTLNSIFPFLEEVRPGCDPCWHIRRGRLLHHYEPVWAVSMGKKHLDPITFENEAQFETIVESDRSRVLLCLVPKWWNISIGTIRDSGSKDTTGLVDKLREACLRLAFSHGTPGSVISHVEFMGTDKEDREIRDNQNVVKEFLEPSGRNVECI
ncbi:hypothetical protein P168DRAFT_154510 [Aspergillus campestris IBT 28561]|uniref:Uncharacterized protein n=1 Tax=Aspergillus campestris (strain IBT 28561) TaxID=1392248 RepID=A0A2I1D2Z9_ASPC2|nr:uncharacterized protein P168DRAFT_154510 [Aspergillus campestris IBT 28561]PKY04239.1 hypothetical protein P168DRAFT_154510 [Aspergillus campestris IBT 28561]